MKIECTQEGRIDQMENSLNSLKKTVMGNGQNGLVQMTTETRSDVKHIMANMDDIKTVVSGFAKFQTEIETEKVVMDKSREVKRWRVRTLVAVVFGMAGIIFTVIRLII